MRVTHVVPSLEDRHGGPSRSVRALANAMAANGTETELATTTEPGHPLPAPGQEAASIRAFPRETPEWLTRSSQLRRHLLSNPSEVVHNHALWLLPLRYAHESAVRHRVPLVISPRGMMSGWAYEHRRWRKRLSEVFVHPGAFRAASGWHATSTEEADDIRKLGFAQPICVSPNGVEVPPPESRAATRDFWLNHCPSLRGRRVALFYSRLHRKKRLRELIDLWLAERRGDWFLLVVGVPEDFSIAEIQGWIDAAKAQADIGIFGGAQKPAPYAVAELFLLPSHSENFGLVIAEALASAVPILVTDTTPWKTAASKQAGWSVTWEAYPAALKSALQAPPTTLSAMGAHGRDWMIADFGWKRAAGILVEFYRGLRS